MRLFWAVSLFWVALSSPAATLEKLSLEGMTQKSTAIVRGRVTGLRTAARGPVIYSFYQVQVAEQWKGPVATHVEVAVPGGSLNGLRQTFSGAPKLDAGVEYILFLWAGRNGLLQVIGLSQGKFELAKDANGNESIFRAASTEQMLDEHGRPTADAPVSMTVKKLNEQIRRALAVEK